jgi:hypothetical protein
VEVEVEKQKRKPAIGGRPLISAELSVEAHTQLDSATAAEVAVDDPSDEDAVAIIEKNVAARPHQ